MQNHTKIYLKYFNFSEEEFIPCEVCRQKAQDIHHIVPRSKFGTQQKEKQDDINNIMALCRKCHNKYGQIKKYINFLTQIHERYVTAKKSTYRDI